MSKFHPIDRDIDFLLPPSVQEWLPEGHLARYVVEVVEGLDLGDLERAYAGKGSAAYHPALLLALLIYGYATGCYSSRKPVLSEAEGIERATYDSLAFRYPSAGSGQDPSAGSGQASPATVTPTTTPWPPFGSASARSSRRCLWRSSRSPAKTS